MSAVRACDDHGYFDADACPECGAAGREVLAADRRRRLSTFVSGALRHFPDDVGLPMDDGGWVPYDALVEAAVGRYGWAGSEHVDAVVETDPKGRFERGGDRVRAAYGHSVDVDLGGGEAPVPDRLYHGTAPEHLDSILAEGLKPMGRQEVHLSGTVGDAREVGRRHADDPVVLAVDAAAMEADGLRIEKRGRETYTADRVPPEYLEVLEA